MKVNIIKPEPSRIYGEEILKCTPGDAFRIVEGPYDESGNIVIITNETPLRIDDSAVKGLVGIYLGLGVFCNYGTSLYGYVFEYVGKVKEIVIE